MRKYAAICLMMTLILAVPQPGIPGAAAQSASSQSLKQKLARLTGPRDTVVIAAPDGKILAGINPDRPLVPASILKLLISLAALDTLGPDYRFRTVFHVDERANLKIKGYGDPLLVSEELMVVAKLLAEKAPFVNDLVLDGSYFEQPVRIPGRGDSSEPYDAPNGALCVNFNTVAFNRINGRWITDEPQTPLLPSAIPKIEASGLTRGRITLAADSGDALQYTGELLRYFFVKAGMQIQGVIRVGFADPEKDRLLWDYRSRHTLAEVVADLLEYSNNFIANQMLLVMGAHISGPPATVDKGLQSIEKYSREALGITSARIVEASGISRANRITARDMLKILRKFEPYHLLMRKNGRQYYKTGHLKGIRTRAGFLIGADGQRFPFVVMINTPEKSTDRIMKTLQAWLTH